ncbi:exodeoxyribonuclease V subunit gamma, partial [Enterobacteriaceae endosymbiont of Donacia piscatrix]|uniref:exodeoxyribonuclease V subunit gamma n=1 Tax=Enterobacteriaceae endosymbiont of Donacia piscatrix TaxID=2675780 RepID=UPI00146FF4F2
LNFKIKRKISISIIIEKINYLIKKKYKNFCFCINKINFCPFHIFQNMSFKKVFMIGMSNEFLPKKINPIIFDLTYKFSNKNKKNYLDKEKNILLKLIISTENKLFISYTNSNLSNDNISILINELLLYISNNYYLKNNFIKYFYRKYQNSILVKKQNMLCFNNFKKLRSININKLSINNLINFWKHPVKGFFNQRLKVYLKNLHDITIFDVESFKINPLQEFLIKKKILHTFLLNKNINNLYLYYLNKGILPYGYYGKIWWEEKIYKINQLFNNQFKKYKYVEKINKINLNISNLVLEGNINYFSYQKNYIILEPKKIDIKSIISLWINHLILCINNNKKFFLSIHGIENTKFSFQFLEKNQAYFLLEKYINGYIYGLNNPILLPMKSSWIWIKSCYDEIKKHINLDTYIQNKSKKKFFYFWNSNNVMNECNDPYFQKLNFYLNHKNWLDTKQLIKKWMFDLLYYSINK